MREIRIGEYIEQKSCSNFHVTHGWLVDVCSECGEDLAPCVAQVVEGEKANHWWQSPEIKHKFVRWRN